MIVKHQKACGVATGEYAVERTYQGDPKSAFGGVWGFGRTFTRRDAEILTERDIGGGRKGWRRDVVFAPDFEGEAIDVIRDAESRPNTRLVSIDVSAEDPDYEARLIRGGVLVQKRDNGLYLSRDNTIESLFKPAYEIDPPQGRARKVGIMTEQHPAKELERTADFGVRVCKQQPSNATVIVREYPGGFQMVGYGVSMTARDDSAQLATERALGVVGKEYTILRGAAGPVDEALLQDELEHLREGRLPGNHRDYREEQMGSKGVGVTDSFFPFPDGLENLAESGIGLIVEPGGSVNDQQVIEAANERGVPLVFTGKRYFKHTDSAGVEF